MEDDFVMPIKDKRGKNKSDKHSHNVKIELDLLQNKKKRFIQSVGTANDEEEEKAKYDKFYEGLSQSEKRKWDKMNREIGKIEGKGVDVMEVKDKKKGSSKVVDMI